jgi:hypothetical protein
VLARVFFRRPRTTVKTGSDSLDHCESAPSRHVTDRKERRQEACGLAYCGRGAADEEPGRLSGTVPAARNQRVRLTVPSRVAGGLRCYPAASERFAVGRRWFTRQVHAMYIFTLTCGFPPHLKGRHPSGGKRRVHAHTRAGTSDGAHRTPARSHGGVRPANQDRTGPSLPTTPLNLDTRIVREQLLPDIQDEHRSVIGAGHVLTLKSPARRSRAGLGVQGVAGMVSLSR